jgi:hypothetical protein
MVFTSRVLWRFQVQKFFSLQLFSRPLYAINRSGRATVDFTPAGQPDGGLHLCSACIDEHKAERSSAQRD